MAGKGAEAGVARKMRGLVTCKQDDRRQHSRCNVDGGRCVQIGLQLPVGRPHLLLSIIDLPSDCSLNDGAGHLHTMDMGIEGLSCTVAAFQSECRVWSLL